MSLYPVNLILTDKPCLVVGGGTVAERKAESLIDAGAKITLISPVITEKLQNFKNDKIFKHLKRKYKSGDLKGFFLVIAATDDLSVNEKIFEEARKYGILINCVDIPEKCNFYIPSVIQRGDMQITISTSGRVPYFKKKMREFFEKIFDDNFENDLQKLYEIRKKIIEKAGNNKDLKEEKISKLLNPEVERILRKIKNKRLGISD